MSTAVATNSKQPPTGQPQQAEKSPLWQKPIPTLGVTGDYGSGKTRFLLSIAPGADTLLFDTEDSSETYSEIGFRRVDIPAEMLKQCPNGYKPIDVFTWWKEIVRKIPPGKFRVIAIDVAEDLEAGLADWVWENPTAFNHTRNQYLKMSGIFFGDVKSLWKPILSDIASRCETFAFAVHQGSVWADGKPTQQKRPKGKSTLMELAALFLQIERPVLPDGSRQSVPSARVLKSRLSHNVIKNGRLLTREILPPRIPEATPEAIREYMDKPADYTRLTPSELAPEQRMSDDQRLEMRVALAQAEADADRMRIERMEKESRADTDTKPPGNNGSKKAVSSGGAGQSDAADDRSGATAGHSEADHTASLPAADNSDNAACQTLQDALVSQANGTLDNSTAEQTRQQAGAAAASLPPSRPDRPACLGPCVKTAIEQLWDEFAHFQKWSLADSMAARKAAILNRYNVNSMKELTDAQAEQIEEKLIEKVRNLYKTAGKKPPF